MFKVTGPVGLSAAIAPFRSRLGWRPACVLAGGALMMIALTGCARSLTIHQDKYINTAPHANRPPDQRTGDPLELNIVVVYPQDLKKPENELLKPDSKITSRDWYAHRPEPGNETGTGRFALPKDQIFLLTKDDKYYGRKLDNALRGAAVTGDKPIVERGIALNWDHVHDAQTVIYIFPKFIGKDGSVLPIAPAKYDPPGAYAGDLEVRIGVHADSKVLDEAQYIENMTPRKLHGAEKG
jgi:hypothetical protein